MSASLVGSEMCIRDRCTRTHARMHEAVQGLAAAAPLPQPTSGKGGHSAVSYTHLTLPTICSV
eukprot:7501526-Alexandrium_andersonii.AAC.1